MGKARGGPSNRLHAKPHEDPGTGLQQPHRGPFLVETEAQRRAWWGGSP